MTPRPGWPAIVEEQGLVYWQTDLPDGSQISYWHEEAFYSLSSAEVYDIEAAARVLLDMLVEAGDYIIENNLFTQMGIPGWAVPRIKETWESEPPMLYGRFDFAYGPDGAAQAARVQRRHPHRLLETAVQWHWLAGRVRRRAPTSGTASTRRSSRAGARCTKPTACPASGSTSSTPAEEARARTS